MSLCGLPGCSRQANELGKTCDLHSSLERFIEPPNTGAKPCRFCGKHHPRNTIDDACPEEWAASAKVRSDSQPKPVPTGGPALWGLVQQDMAGRDSFGKCKYGVRLQPHNGRDFLVDAYQEALDLVVYLRGVIYERDGK